MSSLFGGKPEALVDGDIGTSFGVVTALQENAWLSVDLEAPLRVTEIDVYNRVDGWFDDALPLVVETSIDGARWELLAQRDATFSANPPWRVRLDGKTIRFVRVRSLSKTRLGLSGIAVY